MHDVTTQTEKIPFHHQKNYSSANYLRHLVPFNNHHLILFANCKQFQFYACVSNEKYLWQLSIKVIVFLSQKFNKTFKIKSIELNDSM